MIVFFAFSIVFLLIISWIKKITLFSPYGFFIFFSLLYNVIPYLAGKGIINPIFELDYTLFYINKQLQIVSMSNVIFGIVYLIKYKYVRYEFLKPRIKFNAVKNVYLFFYICLFLILLILCKKYGWNQYSHNYSTEYSTMYSITSYLKYLFVSMYLFYMYKYGLDKKSVLLLILQILLMLVDGARTTFFMVFSGTIIFYLIQNRKIKMPKKITVLLIFVLGIIFIVVARTIIMNGENKGLTSIYVEGQAGSYMALQGILGYTNGYIGNYTYGTNYLIDPFIYFFTKGDLRNSLLYYSKWINELAPYLRDSFAPMGGFYYIAEGISTFPLVGTEIVTGIFAYITCHISNNKNKHKRLYIIYTSTIGVLFSKQIFSNLFTMFLTIYICFLFVEFMYKLLYSFLYKFAKPKYPYDSIRFKNKQKNYFAN